MILQCQTDAYETTHHTECLRCERTDEGVFATFSTTLFYPEGGGQPADRGTVDGAEVLDVQWDSTGEAIHRLAAPVPIGPVTQTLDWERRFDLMQQHTAQHLISALAADRFGLETAGFHLGEVTSTIDLVCPSLTVERRQQLAAITNEAIRQSPDVSIRLVDPDQLAALGVRSRGIRKGHRGKIRLVEIEGIDLNTCGGTHVARIGELQAVTLIGTERMHGNTRVHYLAGGRVLSRFGELLAREQQVTEALTAGPSEHVDRIQKLHASAKRAGRVERRLREALIALLAEALVASDEAVVSHHQTDGDMRFLAGLAGALEARDLDRVAFLTGGAERGAGVFLLVGPPGAIAALGPEVASKLQGRGGGRGGRFQGRADEMAGRQEALAWLCQTRV